MFNLKGMDFTLLQQQRNTLLDVIKSNAHSLLEEEFLAGVVSLLDTMIDKALDLGMCSLGEDGTILSSS